MTEVANGQREVGDALRNVDPWSLDIPSSLAASLATWGDEYAATLSREDPAFSGFANEAMARAWVLTGALLATRLRDAGISVEYFHDGKSSRDLVARAE